MLGVPYPRPPRYKPSRLPSFPPLSSYTPLQPLYFTYPTTTPPHIHNGPNQADRPKVHRRKGSPKAEWVDTRSSLNYADCQSLPRPPERPPPRPPVPPLVVSRSRTDTGPEPSLSERSDDTRSRLSSSSESSPSSDSSERLPRTSRRVDPLHSSTRADPRPTSDSSPPPSWPSRRPPRPTSSPSSRTPTWPPSTPSESPSSPRTSSSPDGSEASDRKRSASD